MERWCKHMPQAMHARVCVIFRSWPLLELLERVQAKKSMEMKRLPTCKTVLANPGDARWKSSKRLWPIPRPTYFDACMSVCKYGCNISEDQEMVQQCICPLWLLSRNVHKASIASETWRWTLKAESCSKNHRVHRVAWNNKEQTTKYLRIIKVKWTVCNRTEL